MDSTVASTSDAIEACEFEQFVLPHLAIGSRGPAPKLSLCKIFNNV
jgi:hypothetical protein